MENSEKRVVTKHDEMQKLRNKIVERVKDIYGEEMSIDVKIYENVPIKLGEHIFELNIVKTNIEGIENIDTDYEFYLNDILIGETDKDGVFHANIEGIKKIDPENKYGLMDLEKANFKPDISEAIKTDSNIEEEIGKKGKESKDIRKNPEEQIVQKVAKEQGKSNSEIEGKTAELSTRSIGLNGENVYDKFRGSKYTSILAVQKEGAVTQFEYKGLTKEGEIEDVKLEPNIYGTNPSEEILLFGNDTNDELKKIMVSDLNPIQGTGGNEFLATRIGAHGTVESFFVRRTPENKLVGVELPQANTRNVDMADREVREHMSGKTTCVHELEEKIDTYEKLKNIDIPSKNDFLQDGIQLLEVNPKIAREELINQLVKDLKGEGTNNTPPGYDKYIEGLATSKVDDILNGKKSYEKALEELKGREEGGRAPGEKRNRNG